ncbi:Chromosome partition protein Smc OS=Streptomyces tendae OX=1932 GN=GUR47_10670 PE=4 SV=1 [Streptomyces tendae]
MTPGRTNDRRESDVTATPSQPYSPSVPRAPGARRSPAAPAGGRPARRRSAPGHARPRRPCRCSPRSPCPPRSPAAVPGAGSAGGRESQRAEAQAAKDDAAAAFYELDTAQRDLRISIETITAVDDSPAARRAVTDFEALGRRIDEVSRPYIAAVDAHDLDRDDLEASAASRARTELTAAKNELGRVKQELDRFAEGLGPLLGKAETQLARLAPGVERARQALLAASNALDTARGSGLKADDLATRLAALGPELTKLNQGAGQHGVPRPWSAPNAVTREAEAVRAEAERLPERAAEIDHRLVSLRTRAQALTTRTEQVEPVLSELRRRFTAACWQDLQHVPDQAGRIGPPGRAETRRGARPPATNSAGPTPPPCCRPCARC